MKNESIKLNKLFACVVLSFLLPSVANAYDQPALNLGYTSFFDGDAPAGTGWYLMEYLSSYSADHLKDKDGKNLALPKNSADADVLLSQLLLISDVKLGTANLGINFILPTILSADVDDGLNNTVLKSKKGIGDLLVGPFIQFAPIMGANGPKMLNRIEFDVIMPTGEYDKNAAVQPSSNFWSLNPYWATTYFFTPTLSASLRLHYLWNGKNDDPNVSFGSTANNTQAGQAIHGNWAVDHALTPQLHVGLNGYWLDQITDTKMNGKSISGRKESVWAFGPGGVYSFSKDDHLFLNAYFEQDAENRPEGNRIQARWVHHF